VEMAVDAIDKKVNGVTITCDIEDKLDERYGEERSEKIQRGAINNLLQEMIEGIFIESDQELLASLNKWRGEIVTRIKEKKESD